MQRGMQRKKRRAVRQTAWIHPPSARDKVTQQRLAEMVALLSLDQRRTMMAEGVERLLEGMVGPEWKDDPNFVGTPQRVARMFQEMLSPSATNWTTFPAKASDLVILRGHKVFAICPHHLQPVELRCAIGYIPGETTVGLSKLARVVEEQLTKPMLQEDLAEAVARTVDARLKPKGVGVVLAGTHGCMRFRGVRSTGDVIVSVMKGVLLLNPTARQEFLQLVGSPESR